MAERMKFSSECKKFSNFYTLSFSAFFLKQFCFTDQWTYSKNHENSDHEMPGCGLRKADGWCAVCRLGPFRGSSQKGIGPGIWVTASGVDNVDVER